MGVDCMMFAEKAKKCVWLHRWYNLAMPPNHPEHAPGTWWLGYLSALDVASRMVDYNEHDGLPAFAKPSAAGNRKTAFEFIKRHGADDCYFILTDHADPSCHEYARAGGFVEERD